VKNVAPSLGQLVSEDRETIYISMLHKFLGCLSLLAVVKLGVAVDTIVSILQQRMTQHIIGRVMPVLPY